MYNVVTIGIIKNSITIGKIDCLQNRKLLNTEIKSENIKTEKYFHVSAMEIMSG